MKILLSFDVEEFDMPLEYGQTLSIEKQLHVGIMGLENLIPLWNRYNIPTTLFTTARFARAFPAIMKSLAKEHEIASHTYYHSEFVNEHLRASKLELERICEVPVYGLRMPRMRKVDLTEVIQAGYHYDSSLNPTWLPGRYNYLSKPRIVHQNEGLTILPASVSPTFRLPLFWLAFKNYPYRFFLDLCKRTLQKDGYLCLYFHPWEFTNLEDYQLPGYVKKIQNRQLVDRLEKLIEDLSALGTYSTIHHYLMSNELIKKT